MRTRFLLVGTVVCALALFTWQTISNAALPWHTATMRTFADDAAAVRAIRAAAPENGTYLSHAGVLAAISIRADGADKSVEMPEMIGRQLVLDLAVALLLCLVVLRLPAASALVTGTTLALAALAISGIQSFSDSIWYGHSYAYSAVNAVDLAINGMVAGLVLGAILNRMRRREAGGVRAEGGLAQQVGGGVSAR